MGLQFACAHVWRAILCLCLLAATSGCGEGSGTTSSASANGDASERTTPQPRNSVTLAWIPPTENTDGSYLHDLAGYRIYSGPSPNNLALRVTLDNAGLSRYIVEPLMPGELYFAITALSSTGMESARSKVVKVPT